MKNIVRLFSMMLCLACVFSACEMKKELKGEGDTDAPKGILNLSLAFVPETRASVEPSANDFSVTVYDENGEVEAYYNTYGAFKAEQQVLLPVGNYHVACAWGERREAALDSPYFLGSSVCEIKEGEVTRTEVSAEIQNVRVNLVLSPDFLRNYRDDYSITLTNGTGVLILDKNTTGSAYFMPGSILKYTIRATTRNGKKALLAGILQNESGSVEAGDQFTIELTTVPEVPEVPVDPEKPIDPDDPSQAGITIQVNVTLTTREIEIVVPTIPVDPTDPTDPVNPVDPPAGIAIAGSGFNIDEVQEFTVESAKSAVVNVSLSASGGMDKVEVRIISPALEAILGAENPFELISPSPTMQTILDGINLRRPTKGDTTFTFEIGPFMQLLTVGDHQFQVTVTDAKGDSLVKTLSVKITA